MLYAIGDIHGEREKLEKLLASLPLLPNDRLVFSGDYIDRGPDAFGVVERLIAVAREVSCIFLMGNHESMFLDFLGWRGRSYFAGDAFLANGGARTLASYGYFDASDPSPEGFRLPPAHEAFFRGLRLWHLEGDYLFVHAGLAPAQLAESDVDFALRRARPDDLLWRRDTWDQPHRLGRTVVYGHTPAADREVRWNLPFSIGIDTGATFGGPLTAIRLPDETLFQT
ncbi:MAG: serine/threonine protein phosphatase [Deltaproteobacteria bacterium]|nr:serine/threonine protein phosphatase [Deltaproteobacteria bacterium]